eukprot:TRINITY_DN15736_c0_g1_i1.p1 TRINITY_DN15736_c0_g1~~TRINITY_DN15736_c0_g1_i1.p1  ORF type:complete len:349 (+),score=55.10 TRINITY_DN15736_c0_g1_i1:15-1061(+)
MHRSFSPYAIRSRILPNLNDEEPIQVPHFHDSAPDLKYKRYSKMINSNFGSNGPRTPLLHLKVSTDRCVMMGMSVTFLITLVIFVVFKTYHPLSREIELTAEETRLITPNTYLYNYIELLDRSSKMHTFVYQEIPPLTTSKKIEINETLSLSPTEYKFWARYLNAGSKVKIDWTLDQLASLYVLRGEDQFDNWKKSPSFRGYEFTVTKAVGSHSLQVEESEDYYFIIESDFSKLKGAPPSSNGFVSFDLRASQYDTAHAKGFFDGSFRMDFDWGGDHFLIITNPFPNHSQTVSITLSTTRATIFYFFFLVIQFIALSVLLLCRSRTSTHPTPHPKASPVIERDLESQS